MYVAVTRARHRLYLSCAQTRMLHGQTRYCIPSSFLDEIPEGLLLKLNVKAAPALSFSASGSYGLEPASGGLRVGQTVEHPKFGVGVIVASEGRGADARVQVNFGGAAGMKWLALEYAKLTPL
jgi:DNA helicase-2/ATP-dependent DNA helicase PcrA